MTPSQFAAEYKLAVATAVRAINQFDVQRVVELIQATRTNGGVVYLCGNGGSAALASHMATDLQLTGVRAVALTDIAAVTTYANDIAYEQCFSRQLAVIGRDQDLLIAISGSGNSLNILRALETARLLGMETLGISGFRGGAMAGMNWLDLHINCASQHMGVAQDAQQVFLHMVAYYLMKGEM